MNKRCELSAENYTEFRAQMIRNDGVGKGLPSRKPKVSTEGRDWSNQWEKAEDNSLVRQPGIE